MLVEGVYEERDFCCILTHCWKKCRKKFINNNFKHKSKALTVFTSLPNNFISKCQPLKKQPHKQIKPYTPIRGLFKAQKLKPCKLL